MTTTQLPELTRVCVVGAGGVAGLTSLAQLLAKGVGADRIVGLEAREVAGGVWLVAEHCVQGGRQ